MQHISRGISWGISSKITGVSIGEPGQPVLPFRKWKPRVHCIAGFGSKTLLKYMSYTTVARGVADLYP